MGCPMPVAARAQLVRRNELRYMARVDSAVVGIDLGTTNSAIGICTNGEIRLFENPLGEVLTPSAVALEPRSGQIIVGRTARDLLARDPSRGALRFKPEMGTNRVFAAGERRLTAVELSAYVLDALRSDAERALGRPVTRAVITVPAYFDDRQRHATRSAAELAGIHVERILNEPTAAAIAYGLHKQRDRALFAIVDLGGGTFDVCVMELFEGVLQVRGVAGDGRLGGEDLTAAVADVLATKAAIAASASHPLLFKRAETAKRALSRWATTEVVIPEAVTGDRELTLQLTVAEADTAWAGLLERMRGPLRAALRGARVDVEQLSEVVLVGGATRTTAVRRVIAEVLGREATAHGDPDLLVAHGAAIQAAMLVDDAAVADVVVTDVCSHSLGVDVAKEIGGRHVDGYFSPIIHRNTTIPTSQWQAYSTLEDYQTSITFVVYEGESRRVGDNRRIGELTIPIAKRALAGVEVRVRFTLDANGMLEVEAHEVKAGAQATLTKVFHRTGGELRGEPLERARSRFRAIRADPLDRPRYRDLYARAKLLWEESPAHQRQSLGHLIDAFEAAIELRGTRDVERAYAALLARVEALDHGTRW